MKKLFLLIAFVCLATVAQAQIPSTLGWYQMPNTMIDTVCAGTHGYPQVLGQEGCKAIESWSGGTFDSTRNRLIVWGGGHDAYYGNELYAVDLDTLATTRLNNPGLPLALDTCCTANGTQAASRHTYDGIEYMPNIDRLFVFGGSPASSQGLVTNDTWTFNFATMAWQKMNPSGPIPDVNPGVVTAYDPNTGKVFLHDNLNLFSYNFSTNSYQQLSNNGNGIDYHMTAVIDPMRKKFVVVGNGQQWIYDISSTSSYTKQALNASGGSALVNTLAPGLDYDPTTGKIVAWNGGNTVYSLDLGTNTWTGVSTFANGPGALTYGGTGTFGRWRYSAALNLFVVVNGISKNAYTFRLNSGSPPPTDTVPPTVTMTAPISGSTVSGSTVTVSANALDNIGVAGVQFKLDGANLGSEDTTAPYAVVWNTTTASNAAHGLTATARDAAGNSTTAAAVSVTVNNVTPPPPSSDFTTRCQAAGVVRCVGFDQASDIAGTYGNNTGIMSGATTPTLDTAVKASGNSAIKFAVPASAGADTSGSYFANFSADLATQFGAGETFYIQWRQRFTPEFISSNAGTGWKQVIIGTGDKSPSQLYASCTDLETVVVNGSNRRFAQMYNSCSGSSSHEAYDPFNEFFGGSDFKMQNARPSPFCLYSQSSSGYFPPYGNCFGYFANEWMTFQVGIMLGSRVGDEFANSNVKLWIAREGQPSELVINWGPYNLTAGSSAENQKYGKVWLLPYNTNRSAGTSYTASTTWYDELIISRNKIADPGTGTPPPADTTPPTVTVTAPAGGSTVSGTSVTVSANASDNVGITGVQFKVDGGNVGSEDTTSPYSTTWNTTTATNATHAVTALARDAAGNQTTSSAVTVTVNNVTPPPTGDTTLPTISLKTSTPSGANRQAFIATVSDNVGVVKAQLFADGTQVDQASVTVNGKLPGSTQLQWQQNPLPAGTHAIFAKACDLAGNCKDSNTVSLTK